MRVEFSEENRGLRTRAGWAEVPGMDPTPSRRELRDAYRFPGFTPSRLVVEVLGTDHARVLTLSRRGKKRRAARVARRTAPGTISACGAPAISPVAICGSGSRWRCAASRAGPAAA